MRISDWSSYVCSSDLQVVHAAHGIGLRGDGFGGHSILWRGFWKQPTYGIKMTVPDTAGGGAMLSPAERGEPVIRSAPMPADMNGNGDIFGGWVLSQMDIAGGIRSEEHTSELQSHMRISYAVSC